MQHLNNVPALASQRNISSDVWSAIKNSIFPGASDESVAMAWDYCSARQLDVMLKPVHLVPMYIKDKQNGDKGSMRDVVMPGIGLYRIQADRSGNYAGMNPPVFGEDVLKNIGGVEISYPEWCEITVKKLIGDRVVEFTAREYWIENYATAGRDVKTPNSMWQKRPRGQIIKCAEAQALRKAWPELGAQPTAEEMDGKHFEQIPAEREIIINEEPVISLPEMSNESFNKNFSSYEKGISSGRKSADQVIATLSSKYTLTAKQIKELNDIKITIEGEVVNNANA